MKVIGAYEGQHWSITPTALALNEPAPATISDQRWTLVLSGVAIVDVPGTTSVDWTRETLLLLPSVRDPMLFAIDRFGIPRPQAKEHDDYETHFQVQHWAPFAALSSVFDRHQSIDAGYAVDRWRAHDFFTGTDFFTGQAVPNIWSGVDVDVAVRDSDAVLHRVGYHITLVGRIRFRKAHTGAPDLPLLEQV